MGASPRASASSSSDIDHEEVHRLRSVAVDSSTVALRASTATESRHLNSIHEYSAPLKFYQNRARDRLHEYLDRTFALNCSENKVDIEQNMICSKAVEDNVGFRLFKRAPPGLSFKDSFNDPGRGKIEAFKVLSRKRRGHLDGNDNENSEKFKSCLQAAVIDGTTIKEKSVRAISKAFTSWLAKEAAEKEAQRIEEERVLFLKHQHGEKWLPSVARAMAMEKLSDTRLVGSLELGKSTQESRPKVLAEHSLNLQIANNPVVATEHNCQKESKKQNKKKRKAVVRAIA